MKIWNDKKERKSPQIFAYRSPDTGRFFAFTFLSLLNNSLAIFFRYFCFLLNFIFVKVHLRNLESDCIFRIIIIIFLKSNYWWFNEMIKTKNIKNNKTIKSKKKENLFCFYLWKLQKLNKKCGNFKFTNLKMWKFVVLFVFLPLKYFLFF